MNSSVCTMYKSRYSIYTLEISHLTGVGTSFVAIANHSLTYERFIKLKTTLQSKKMQNIYFSMW